MIIESEKNRNHRIRLLKIVPIQLIMHRANHGSLFCLVVA